jgi:hypothetical protein
MIDAKELRIGNLLKNDGVIITVDGRTIFDIYFKIKENYSPISITKSFLKRNHFISYSDESFIRDGFVLTKVFAENEWFFQGGIRGRKIKFIHELQNAFYFLTGKEIIDNG